MFASTPLPPAMQRASEKIGAIIRQILMLAGLFFIFGLSVPVTAEGDLRASVQAFVQNLASNDEDETTDPTIDKVGESEAPLSPPMRHALANVAQRYRVSADALRPIFFAAQQSGHELKLDPLLIVAVIGIESGFNPLSQSVMGAQGLMQLIPRFHADKLPEDAGERPFFDPVTNVQVGARVLKESITRFGSLKGGLQQFGGALNDPDQHYANRVLSERSRLERAAKELRAA
jgi:Transglycosylase SLT domain